MKKQILLTLTILIFIISCESVKKKDFYIIQDSVLLGSENIMLKKEPFSIISNGSRYFVMFAKEPISYLKNKKKIVKLIGTAAVWDINGTNAALYEPSDILSDNDMYELYDKIQSEKYISKKRKLGFENDKTYTFASYPVTEKKKRFLSIDNQFIKDVSRCYYYIYLFKNIGRIGTVSDIQEVTRLKINFID